MNLGTRGRWGSRNVSCYPFNFLDVALSGPGWPCPVLVPSGVERADILAFWEILLQGCGFSDVLESRLFWLFIIV